MEIHLRHSDQVLKVRIVFITLTHLANIHKSNIYLYMIATLPMYSKKVQANLHIEKFINRLMQHN